LIKDGIFGKPQHTFPDALIAITYGVL